MNTRTIMPIETLKDWDMRLKRQDAFWHREILDRPTITVTYSQQPIEQFLPQKNFASHRDRWLDIEYQVEVAIATVKNTVYIGDALPSVWPNLGPEVFSAWFGTELEYGETTAWAIPNLHNWEEVDKLLFSKENFYWKKMMELTNALLEAGQNKFYVGYTDIHPGGDAIAAFRDPEKLNLDLIDVPHLVLQLREKIDAVFKQVFVELTTYLQDQHHQAITTWPRIVSTYKYYVPSNDFSCMISKTMFDEYFLPGIIEECRVAEASIYHLDGPQALRHLDSLLEIPELNAIQWVPGTSYRGSHQWHSSLKEWLPVYKRCQEAKKGLQIFASLEDIPFLIEHLDPHGVWLGVRVNNQDEALYVMNLINRWK